MKAVTLDQVRARIARIELLNSRGVGTAIEQQQFELACLRELLALRERAEPDCACNHVWSALTRADTLECIYCGIIKRDWVRAKTSPAPGVVTRQVLRDLVDAAWMHATESEEVPATTWADSIIDDVLSSVPVALRERAEPVAELYAELYRLREEVKGPNGFATWKSAAIAEKTARVKCESLLNQRSRDIDYLTAMAAFHSSDWHKMSPITAYMHGWNARKAGAVDSSVERDARRYRFLRDKDAFGDDAEPGLVSWDELTDLDLCDFDAAVDARLAAAGFEPLYTAPPAQVVIQPVSAPYKLPVSTEDESNRTTN
ncbi:hypothetical protein ACMS1L_002420 [Cronobacter turicensis]